MTFLEYKSMITRRYRNSPPALAYVISLTQTLLGASVRKFRLSLFGIVAILAVVGGIGLWMSRFVGQT